MPNTKNKEIKKEKILISQLDQTKSAQMKPTQIPQALGLKTVITSTVTDNKYTGDFGVAVEDYANRYGTITALEEKLGTKISTISIYKQFGNPDNKDLIQSDLTYAKSRDMRLQIAWEPWDSSEGNEQSLDYLKDIPIGKYDDYIHNFASEIKAFGNPVELRFGHEMYGNWYPWGNRPAEYIAAYRYIHELFIKENVSNVSWMWSVNITENPSELRKFYPGDDVVNVIGVDGFNFGTTRNYGGWRSFSLLFGPTLQFLAANYPKPLSISETASTEFGGDKAVWIKNMFMVIPQFYPKIKEIVWFNLLKETDWRIESSQGSINAFYTSLHK